MMNKIILAVVKAVLPHGYIVMRDYTKPIYHHQYVTLEKNRDYKYIN